MRGPVRPFGIFSSIAVNPPDVQPSANYSSQFNRGEADRFSIPVLLKSPHQAPFLPSFHGPITLSHYFFSPSPRVPIIYARWRKLRLRLARG